MEVEGARWLEGGKWEFWVGMWEVDGGRWTVAGATGGSEVEHRCMKVEARWKVEGGCALFGRWEGEDGGWEVKQKWEVWDGGGEFTTFRILLISTCYFYSNLLMY